MRGVPQESLRRTGQGRAARSAGSSPKWRSSPQPGAPSCRLVVRNGADREIGRAPASGRAAKPGRAAQPHRVSLRSAPALSRRTTTIDVPDERLRRYREQTVRRPRTVHLPSSP